MSALPVPLPMTVPLPAYFIPHGAGPWPFVPQLAAMHGTMETFLRDLLAGVGRKPSAILIVSAHWEERVATVSSRSDFSMLYDYGGFPPQTYQLQYPAPGAPGVAARVIELAAAAGLHVAEEHVRGYDHGVFVPLMVAAPDAAIPLVPLSLMDSLDPAAHIALGRALAPLRHEDVLIIGSGMSMHNARALMSRESHPSGALFDAWLNGVVTGDVEQREARLTSWAAAPGARFSHPREDHLLPLMVVAGAAGEDLGHRIFHDHSFGAPLSGFRFGP
jgi:aromatic ring-opening dioxygenase catalytic subunit (LigB family)